MTPDDAPTPKSPDRAQGGAGAEALAVLCEICQQPIPDSDPGADDEHGMLAHGACYAQAITPDAAPAHRAPAPGAAGPADAVAGGLEPRWRHVGRGTVYEEVGRAELQQSYGDVLPREGDTLVIYRGPTGKLWAREASEFEDGRFERLDTTLSDPGAGRAGADGLIHTAFTVTRADLETLLQGRVVARVPGKTVIPADDLYGLMLAPPDRGEGAALPGVEEIAEAIEADLVAIERQVRITGELDRNETAAKKTSPIGTTVEISLSHVLDTVKRIRARLTARGTAQEGAVLGTIPATVLRDLLAAQDALDRRDDPPSTDDPAQAEACEAHRQEGIRLHLALGLARDAADRALFDVAGRPAPAAGPGHMPYGVVLGSEKYELGRRLHEIVADAPTWEAAAEEFAKALASTAGGGWADGWRFHRTPAQVYRGAKADGLRAGLYVIEAEQGDASCSAAARVRLDKVHAAIRARIEDVESADDEQPEPVRPEVWS